MDTSYNENVQVLSDKRNSVIKMLVRYASRYGIYIALALIVVVLSLLSNSFLTIGNILTVLRQSSIIGLISIGMTFVIITGGIDLSVGAIVSIVAVTACSFAHPNTYPLIVPVLIGLGVGLACGIINGLIISYGRIAPFLVTLGMLSSARGAAFVISKGKPVTNLDKYYNLIGGGKVLSIPIPVWILFIVAAIGIFILSSTKFGRHVYALGGNEQAARLSGVKTDTIKVAVYSISGLLAGLSGIVLSSRVMTGNAVDGQGYELDAIAAVVIGGTSLVGGIGGIAGTIVGVLIIGVISNGLDILFISYHYQQIIKGLIILVAVILDRINASKR